MAVRVLTLLLLAAAVVSAVKIEIDCDLVRCARPLCEDGVPLVTPSGQCCPVCDPTTAEPETKQPEETEQPETLPPVNTEPATSSEPATEKPCQVKGALLVKCASGCPATCLNPSVSCFVMICDVPGLCECPAGQVVNQVNNRCVPLEECPSAADSTPEPKSLPTINTEEPATTQETETDAPKPKPLSETLPTPAEQATVKPCDIEGALPVKCASPCPATCTRQFVICDVIVCDSPRLCACPGGQVVDEVHNRCVPPDDCPPPGSPASVPPGTAEPATEPEPETKLTDIPPEEEEEESEEEEEDGEEYYGDEETKPVPQPNPEPELGDYDEYEPEKSESSPHSKPDPEDGSTDLLECPPDQPLSLCKTDPCDVNTCPVYPNARCKAHFCGGCHARFFDGDDEVTGSCDPCALTDCAPGHLCEVYKPTGEAVCEPYCDLDNGGCPPDQLCQLTQPQCIRAPCPPLVECVGGTDEPEIVTKPNEGTEASEETKPTEPEATEPEVPDKPKPTDATDETFGTKLPESTTAEPESPNEPGKPKATDATYGTKPPQSTTPQATSTPSSCPPVCSMEFCTQKGNKRVLCTAPGPQDLPGCTGGCQLTYCHACYNWASSVDVPGSCEQCGEYTAESSCFKAWAKCVRRAQIAEYGRLAKRLRTESNFRCHRPPCGLLG